MTAKRHSETVACCRTGSQTSLFGNGDDAHDGIEFVVRDSHHLIASDDAATHPSEAEEGDATEHLAFGDVVTGAECNLRAARRRPADLATNCPPSVFRDDACGAP